MTNPKIAVIITTFLRDELLFKCINSILENWNENYILYILDQGHPTEEKKEYFNNFPHKDSLKFIELPFDCGPLAARNYAIRQIAFTSIEYILMSADSILFTSKYEFTPIIEFLEQEEDRFLCAFYSKDRIPWEADVTKKSGFYLKAPEREPIIYKDISFQPVDLANNFFIAKASLFAKAEYDKDRKLGDHESSYWRFKEKGYKCFFTKSIDYEYVKDRTPEYNKYRDLFYTRDKIQMMNHYGLSKWVEYDRTFLKSIEDYRKNKKQS